MENRDRSGAGNSSSKQDFWRRGSSSVTTTTNKATFTIAYTPSSTNHQRKLSSASTKTTGSTGITRPRSLTATKSAKEHPPPTTARHRRLSSTSVTSTSAQPATSSCNVIYRVAQRTNNLPPFLSRSATAPVLSRHEVVTAVHTDKESSSRNANLIDKKGTTQSARVSSSAPPNKPLKPNSTVLPPTTSKLQQPTTARINHQHRHTPSVTTSTTSLPINPTHSTAPNNATAQSTNSSPPSDSNQDPNLLTVSFSRPGSSHASARSSPTPPKKHAPARFSSNGVETSGGPPPSLAYRRRFSMDNRGVYSTPSTPNNRPGYTRDQGGDSSTSSATVSALSISRTGTAQGQRDIRRHTTKAMQRRQSYSSYDEDDEDDDEEDESGERDRTIRGLEDLRNNGGVPASSDQGNEDIFLKLARSDSITSRAADRLEKRRVSPSLIYINIIGAKIAYMWKMSRLECFSNTLSL